MTKSSKAKARPKPEAWSKPKPSPKDRPSPKDKNSQEWIDWAAAILKEGFDAGGPDISHTFPEYVPLPKADTDAVIAEFRSKPDAEPESDAESDE